MTIRLDLIQSIGLCGYPEIEATPLQAIGNQAWVIGGPVLRID